MGPDNTLKARRESPSSPTGPEGSELPRTVVSKLVSMPKLFRLWTDAELSIELPVVNFEFCKPTVTGAGLSYLLIIRLTGNTSFYPVAEDDILLRRSDGRVA